MESKICIKCNIIKIIENFTFIKRANKYSNECKACKAIYDKQYATINKERKRKNNINYRINKSKNISQRGKKYYEENKEKISTKQKIRYDKNGVIIRRKSYEKNKKEINARKKLKRQEDDLYKLSISIRNSIKQAFKAKNHKKNSKSIEILGCTFYEFKKHIEKQFESWMNWDNYGILRKDKMTWQLDHKIPVSSAKTKEELLKINHYTNFQPLESLANNLKSNQIL